MTTFFELLDSLRVCTRVFLRIIITNLDLQPSASLSLNYVWVTLEYVGFAGLDLRAPDFLTLFKGSLNSATSIKTHRAPCPNTSLITVVLCYSLNWHALGRPNPS